MSESFLFTSESVGEGHPDKICDQISDAILDAHLAKDPLSRVACEVLVKNDSVVVAGEISSNGEVNYEEIVRRVIGEIGYTEPELGFDAESCELIYLLSKQSNDISVGVTEGEGLFKEQGAGDQGLMFGFACDETSELMPLPIFLAHALTKQLADLRRQNQTFLKPDAKSQVTVRYEDGSPVAIDAVVVSTQHSAGTPLKDVEQFVMEEVVKKVIPAHLLTSSTRYYINPTGIFVVGGPVGDCGLTGRKIIVDTYGGYGRHGGGAFSGKDPSKVDRSAAYAARWVAKHVVAAGLAKRCEVQIAYAIGVAEPVSIFANTFGTGKLSNEELSRRIREVFTLTPKGIINDLQLLKPIYQSTAAYGHFGRTATAQGHFSWEKLDRVKALAG